MGGPEKPPSFARDTADRHCPESRDEPRRPRLITLIATNVTNVSKRYEPSPAPTSETFARRLADALIFFFFNSFVIALFIT